MQIYYHTDQLPAFRRAVITIGTFDGVHIGHAQILQQLRQEAARIDGETVIVTFYPHPRKIVRGGTAEVRLINTLEEKIQLLSWQQVGHLVVVPFTADFAEMTAGQYVKEFLLERFHPHTVIIGYDHRFGKGRQGDYHLLEEFSRSEGFELQEIPVHLLDAVSVSSTRIREAIAGADIESANQLLGYPFFFSGQVMEGRRLGRTIGFPTANLQVGSPDKLIPGDGVYAVEVEVVDDSMITLTAPNTVPAPGNGDPGAEPLRTPARIPWSATPFSPRSELPLPGSAVPSNGLFRWKGMMNIGMRPTVDGRERTIEVNIFDFNEDLYGRELRVFVNKYLRGEEKFSGLDALKAQLARDKQNSLAALSGNGR
jgi:riboflavin kinase/FMN adenylyltransferase